MTRTYGIALAGLALLAANGCSCEQKTSTRTPKMEVLDDMGNARTLVDFGKVQLNTTGTQALRIRNSGSAPLNIGTAVFTDPKFASATTIPTTIDVNGELMLDLTFKPVDADLRVTGTVTFTSDDPEDPMISVQLAGMGVNAIAVVQPAIVNFGDVYVNESKTVDVTLTNAGSNDLDIQSVTFNAMIPPQVTGDLTKLKQKVAAGASVSTTLQFAPIAIGVMSGGVDIALGGELGTITVPVRGRAVLAVPKACFTYDDTSVELCADVTSAFVNIPMGSLCDDWLYPPDGGTSPCRSPDGGVVGYTRSGKLVYRNGGNVPIAYSVQYSAQTAATCDAGSSIDFLFSNAPDSGVASWGVNSVVLPTNVSVPMPWDSAPIDVTYRARSACTNDAADQARLVWTRGTLDGGQMDATRMPSSFIMTFTGQSQLPKGLPSDVNMSGAVPQSVDFHGVLNGGDAPLRVTSATIWQADYLADGGRSATPFELCDSLSTGDCRYFVWAPGNDPASVLPITLAGTPLSTAPTSQIIGKIEFGPPDAGSVPQQNVSYHVFVVIQTDDPYNPQVIANVTGKRTQ